MDRSVLLMSCAVLALGVPAYAQEVSRPPAHASDVEEVIVTARKREESLQDVPVAVTYVSGSTMEKRGITSFADLAMNNPNVKITPIVGNSIVGTAVAIRGNLQSASTIQVDPSVGLYLDGHVIPHTLGLAGVTVDVESVQTLKGPQGTLFGRNTTGGAMLVKTRDPVVEDFSGYVQGEFGELGTRRVAAAVNVPLGPLAAVRIIYANNHRGGYQSFTNGLKQGDKRDETVRGKLLFKPGDNTSILLSREKSVEFGHATNDFGSQPNAPRYKDVPVVPVTVNAISFPAAVSRTPIDPRIGDEPQKGVATLNGLTITQALFGGELKLLASDHEYKVRLAQTLGPALGYTFQNRSGKDTSVELQYSAAFLQDRVDATAGLYYFDETILEDQNTFGFSGDARTARILTQDALSRSAYGQATVHLTDKLNVTGGARYTMDKKAAVLYGATLTMPAGTRPGQVGVTPLLLGTREAALANPPATRTLKNKKSNYMVSVDYSPVQHVMVYVSTATGYRAGGTGVDRFTEVTAATVNTIRNNPNYYLTTFFLPESITNYEAGLKAQFLENHVTLNAAAFRQKYGNYQYSGIDPVTQTRTTNNADATIRGVELEIILRLGTGTTISGDYGITDAKAKGAGFLAVGAPVAGRSLPGIPKLMYGVSVDQKFELGEAILDLVANYSWRDDYNQYFVVATDIGSRVESVGLLNLSATYVREPWTAAIFANNVTNEKYFTSITYSNPVLSSATLGISRIFGGRLRYSF